MMLRRVGARADVSRLPRVARGAYHVRQSMSDEAKDRAAELQACDIATQFVHAGELLPLRAGTPVATPIYTTATYTYDSMAEMDAVFADDVRGYVYARYGNPTVHALETALATL